MRSGMIVFAFVGLLSAPLTAWGQNCSSIGMNPYYRGTPYGPSPAAVPPSLRAVPASHVTPVPPVPAPGAWGPATASPYSYQPYPATAYSVPGYPATGYSVPGYRQPQVAAYPVMHSARYGSWPSSMRYQAYRPTVASRSYVGQGLLGQPKAFVSGQPILNLLRFITP